MALGHHMSKVLSAPLRARNGIEGRANVRRVVTPGSGDLNKNIQYLQGL